METVALDAKLDAGAAPETVTVTSTPPQPSDAMLSSTVLQRALFRTSCISEWDTAESYEAFYTHRGNVGGSALSLSRSHGIQRLS
jgi:hypothetical protein